MKLVFHLTILTILLIPLSIGNIFYQNEKYSNSKAVYEIIDNLPDGFGIIDYNIGSAQYRESEYEDSIESFEKALESVNSSGIELFKARILYNLGNAHYREGETYLSIQPKDVIEQWQDAIKAYEQVLELDPDNQLAKENLEFVKARLKAFKDQNTKVTETDDPSDADVEADIEDIEESETENRAYKNETREFDDYKDNPPKEYDKPNW